MLPFLPFDRESITAPAFPSLLDAARATVGNVLACFTADCLTRNVLAVDATCGNGNDTLFLARLLGHLAMDAKKDYGVLAIDLQQAALSCADSLLADCRERERVALVLAGHENLAALLAEYAGAELCAGRASPITAVVMYNLGFLPRSDKTLVTSKKSTLASLEAAKRALAPGGVLVIHAYGGHEGGADELEAVGDWCTALPYKDWLTASYALANKPRNPETLFMAQKRRRLAKVSRGTNIITLANK